MPINYVNLKATADVEADLLKKIGLKVDYVTTDWGQMLTRATTGGRWSRDVLERAAGMTWRCDPACRPGGIGLRG